MEKLFENKTKYTNKEYTAFLKSYKEEFAKTEIAYILFNIIFFGMCMIFSFKENEKILAFSLLIGLLVYIWFKIIRPVKAVKKDQESHKFSGHFVNNYEFYKNYFKVENTDGKAQIFYLKLFDLSIPVILDIFHILFFYIRLLCHNLPVVLNN